MPKRKMGKAAPRADEKRRADRQDIVDALEWDIIFGRIHFRERLIEDDLIARFGSTRHKIRDALVELGRRGLVVQVRNKGAQVRGYSVEEVRGLYDVRNALQTQAIRRMTLPFGQDRLDRLTALHTDLVASGAAEDVQQMFHLNERFHAVFFEACDLPVLIDAISDYAWRTHPIRSRGYFDADYRRQAHDDHARIVDLAAHPDPEARADLMAINRHHINRPRDRYLASIEPAFLPQSGRQ